MAELKSTAPRKRGTICSGGWWQSSVTGGVVHYQSTYEREFMRLLDDHNILWKRNTKRFPYLLDDKKHNYIPDFYLPEANIYVETKGFIRKADPIKFEAFPEDQTLVLLEYQDLLDLGCNVKPVPIIKDGEDKWPMRILKSKGDDWHERGVLTEELKKKVSKEPLLRYLKEKFEIFNQSR